VLVQVRCPHYMPTMKDVTPRMREVLVDWLIEVHMKFRMDEASLYLTVQLVDRAFSRMPGLPRTKIQLVGMVGALFVCATSIVPCAFHGHESGAWGLVCLQCSAVGGQQV
jgi:hypothetical protein